MPTLLLADDNVTTQRVIALTFADPAFQVVTVGSSQQARDLMAGMRPDIVLASTSLPRNTGYELSEYMLGVETLKDVPVLLLSGAFESVDEARLATSGARGVIEKPLEPTAVINRVRELLGLKEAQPAPPAGRLITPAATPADKTAADKTPAQEADTPPPVGRKGPSETPPRDPLAAAVARAAQGNTAAQARDDYRDTLDTAFDSLDQHLAGKPTETPAAPESRAPGRALAADGEGGTADAVFEVDNDWFADDPKPRDRASHHDILADANAAMPRATAPVDPIFEVDDDWFAEDEKARQSSLAQQRELAAEMGIHDLELPAAEPVPNAPAPAEGLDFDFGLDDLLTPRTPKEQTPSSPASALEPEPTATAPMPDAVAYDAPALEPPAPVSAVPEVRDHVPTVHQELDRPAPLAPLAPSSVADDFAALLAIETGDAPPPVVAAQSVVTQAAAPEITDAMLDQIAQRVADRLSSGTFGAELREAMSAALRDSVRTVVAETAERLVREEIARVKARIDRDTP
jgi:CheY-like chemotaxis protein